MNTLFKKISGIGAWTRTSLIALGGFMRLSLAILAGSGIVLRRPRLVIQQIHFIGNHSVLIIAVSGLFVGFVLGLQGFYTLSRYGSEIGRAHV